MARHKIPNNHRSPLRGVHGKIVDQRQKGVSVVLLSQMFGVSRQAIYDVLKEAEQKGASIPWHKPEKKPSFCVICAREFMGRWGKKSRTCSPECLKKLRHRILRERHRGSKWSKFEFLDLVCAHCGASFKRTKYQQSIGLNKFPDKKDFCGRKCANRSRQSRN